MVRADRAIFLSRQMCAPDDEIAIRVGESVEFVVEHRLAEEDHALGAAGRRHRDEIVEIARCGVADGEVAVARARRLRSEEHTSELQPLMRISYASFCRKNRNGERLE